MSRPEFPNCIMPTNVINRIREQQEAYDKNPEEYERREEQRQEDLREEMEQDHIYEMRQQQQEEMQNWQDEILITEPETTADDLPF